MSLTTFSARLAGSARQTFAIIAGVCIAMLAFSQYLQHVVGIEPCPMCIVQRYVFVLIALIATLSALSSRRSVHIGGAALLLISAVFGAYVAARQSWLQWYPPEVSSCGRDFYGMIETFPLQRAIPMIFRGSGDCSKVDWTFLGGSIANWAFLCFTAFSLLALLLLGRQFRRVN